MLSLVQSLRPLGERAVAVAAAAGGAGAVEARRPTKELLMTLPCPSAQTVSKYNSQFHKLFQCVPKDEILMKGETGRTRSRRSSGRRSWRQKLRRYFTEAPEELPRHRAQLFWYFDRKKNQTEQRKQTFPMWIFTVSHPATHHHHRLFILINNVRYLF